VHTAGKFLLNTFSLNNTREVCPVDTNSSVKHTAACRVYDCTSWNDHKLQPEGVHATRVDLSDVSDQNYFALFCERNRIYLCAKDHLGFFKGLWAESPGALLVRGYSTFADAQVRSCLLLIFCHCSYHENREHHCSCIRGHNASKKKQRTLFLMIL
jgi:hypothetical protein